MDGGESIRSGSPSSGTTTASREPADDSAASRFRGEERQPRRVHLHHQRRRRHDARRRRRALLTSRDSPARPGGRPPAAARDVTIEDDFFDASTSGKLVNCCLVIRFGGQLVDLTNYSTPTTRWRMPMISATARRPARTSRSSATSSKTTDYSEDSVTYNVIIGAQQILRRTDRIPRGKASSPLGTRALPAVEARAARSAQRPKISRQHGRKRPSSTRSAPSAEASPLRL